MGSKPTNTYEVQAAIVETNTTGVLNKMLGAPVGVAASATIDVEEIEGGHKVSVTDINGTTNFDIRDGIDGKDGYTPIKGVDYYTDAEQQEMVNRVLAALPVYGGEIIE